MADSTLDNLAEVTTLLPDDYFYITTTNISKKVKFSAMGANKSITPTLSGGITVVETSPLVVTIDNYEANTTYYFTTSSGTASITGNQITVIAGSVTADEAGHTLTVTSAKDGYLLSDIATHTFTVINATIQNDTDYAIASTGGVFNATNYPISTNGTVVTTVGDEGLLTDINNSTFTSLAVAKADAQGDWNGTQSGASIVSELPDRLSSADATTAVIDGEILPTDKVYLGDGTSFAEVVDAGASYDGVALKTTITHGQAFTPTFACSAENTGLKVSADNGATKYPLVKSGSSFSSLGLVSSVDPFMDGGLAAKYLLDGNVNDITGNHNGSLTGGTYTAGKFGNALKLLNGQYVSTPTSILGSLTDFTFSTFFKTTKASGVQCRFMWDGVPGSATYQNISLQDNILYTGNYNFALGTSEVLHNANDGLWHHIALTRVEVTGAINVYFDGVLKVFTVNVAGSGHVSSGNTHNPIGNKNYPDTDHIQDITEYYTRVLTQSEVTELYNQKIHPTIQETFDAKTFVNTGTNLVHEVTHKEATTKTTAINVGLTELV